MSKMETNVLSEGEISNDSDENERYSIISSGEDEYFKNLTNEIKTRQAELELENVLLRGYGIFNCVLFFCNVKYFNFS